MKLAAIKQTKDVQNLELEKDELVKQLIDRKRAAARAQTRVRAQSRKRKAAEAQRKKSYAAAKQTRLATIKAKALNAGLRKKNERLQAEISLLRLKSTNELMEEQGRTKEARDKLVTMRAELQAYEYNYRDVSTEDVGPVQPSRQDLELQLNVAQDSNRKLRQEPIEAKAELQYAGNSVESQSGLPTPKSTVELDTAMTDISASESKQIDPPAKPKLLKQTSGGYFSNDASPFGFSLSWKYLADGTASTPVLVREIEQPNPPGGASQTGQDSEQPDAPVWSPREAQPSSSTAGDNTGVDMISESEIKEPGPNRGAQTGAKNHLRRRSSSGSRLGQQSRITSAGISKRTKASSKLESGNKHPPGSNIRPASESQGRKASLQAGNASSNPENGRKHSKKLQTCLGSELNVRKKLLKAAKLTSSSSRLQFPWMETLWDRAAEEAGANARNRPITVPAPKSNATKLPNTDIVIPSDTSERIEDSKLQWEYLCAAEAYYEGRHHKDLRAAGLVGKFYLWPKNWIRREFEDMANVLRTTGVDNSADSLIGSLGSVSVDGSSYDAATDSNSQGQANDKDLESDCVDPGDESDQESDHKL